MRPAFLDNMSWAMAEVYAATTDRILINLARHFPMVKPGEPLPGAYEYQARMLAQMGQVNSETVDIIMGSLGSADNALRAALEASIVEALKDEEPQLRKAAEKGLLMGGSFAPEVAPGQMQAFKAYYRQSADKLNLVNTVMLESTQAAYQATVSDVTTRIQRTQSILNTSAGEVVTGVSTYNQAMRDAVRKMVDNGLTGFVDHGGHRWSPEAYVAMDIRTTMYNTSRAAIWERADSYGCDTYQVSSHNGARPLCAPWQAKVISRSNTSGMVEDLHGNKVRVYAQSETSYGQAAGLFGVNCRHYPMTFIPGFSTLKGQPQSEEENAKTYEQTQEQRGLERKLRAEKRDLEVLKAQGASPEAINAQKERVRNASADIDDFCKETGLPRRKAREYAPINAKFPNPETYDPADFPTEQRDKMREFFSNGARSSQTGTQPPANVAPGSTSAQEEKPTTEKKRGVREMTREESDAVESYVSGDTMYINQVLRGKAGEATPEDRELIKQMDSALDVPIGKKQTLYRSVDAQAVFGDITSMQYENIRGALVYNDSYGKKQTEAILQRTQGKTILEKGYMSTTKDYEIAAEWGGYTGSEMPIVIVLETPASAHGRDLQMFEVEGEEQQEVLLARNQRYKVNRIGAKDGNIVVYAEIVEK